VPALDGGRGSKPSVAGRRLSSSPAGLRARQVLACFALLPHCAAMATAMKPTNRRQTQTESGIGDHGEYWLCRVHIRADGGVKAALEFSCQRAHLPIAGGASGMGDLPAIASGEGWVLLMLPGARSRARCPCHSCARQTPPAIGDAPKRIESICRACPGSGRVFLRALGWLRDKPERDGRQTVHLHLRTRRLPGQPAGKERYDALAADVTDEFSRDVLNGLPTTSVRSRPW